MSRKQAPSRYTVRASLAVPFPCRYPPMKSPPMSMFPKASLTGRVLRTNNTMRMAKSWGSWRRPGAGAALATILPILAHRADDGGEKAVPANIPRMQRRVRPKPPAHRGAGRPAGGGNAPRSPGGANLTALPTWGRVAVNAAERAATSLRRSCGKTENGAGLETPAPSNQIQSIACRLLIAYLSLTWRRRSCTSPWR